MKISMIAAIDRNRVIGTGQGGLPWHLPRDVRHFRDYTQGKHLLIGRRTFEEMRGWITDQTPLVLTHRRDYQPETGLAAHTVDEAVAEGFELGAPELVVCGGAQAYAAALPYADELRLTRIDAETAGTVQFPDYESDHVWETISEESHGADAENPLAMTFVTLRRVKPSSLRPSRLHLL